MRLNLSVDGKLLATIPVDPKRWKDDDYLHDLTCHLAKTNETAISALRKPPSYYIEVSSKINRSRIRK
jgi:hypothetical protein